MQERRYWRIQRQCREQKRKYKKLPPNIIKQKLAKQTKYIICEMKEWKTRKDSKKD